MSKSNHYKSFVIATIVLLIIPSLTVLNVKAQTTPTPDNWSRVAMFADSRSGYYIITDPFTCDHVEWRIKWNVDLNHMHFDISNYIMQIVIFPEGTSIDYIDVINGSLSTIFDSGDRAGGTHIIHGNAGTFYLRIATSPYVDSYGILVEQNTDSPIPSPTPTLTPTPSTSPTPDYTPIVFPDYVEFLGVIIGIASGVILSIAVVLILRYFKKRRT